MASTMYCAAARPGAAGEMTGGRRAHTVWHGQGKPAWTERLETEVVGISGWRRRTDGHVSLRQAAESRLVGSASDATAWSRPGTR
jgi:hypothetical protein